MAIALTCPGCDKTMKVKDEFAGKRALCPFCKAEIHVPKREEPRVSEAEDYALNEDTEDREVKPKRRRHRDDDETEDREVEPKRRPRRDDDEDDKPRRRPRLKSADRDSDGVYRRKSSGVSGNVLSGVLMMGGALVWFFVALALGWIAFYPPVLFCIGLYTFIKGLSGNDE